MYVGLGTRLLNICVSLYIIIAIVNRKKDAIQEVHRQPLPVNLLIIVDYSIIAEREARQLIDKRNSLSSGPAHLKLCKLNYVRKSTGLSGVKYMHVHRKPRDKAIY